MISTPKTLKAACPMLWHTADSFIEHYNRFDLVRMSEQDLLLAANVIANHKASWTFNNEIRLDSHLAKVFKTTVKRIENLFPHRWYYEQGGVWYIRIPQDVLDYEVSTSN